MIPWRMFGLRGRGRWSDMRKELIETRRHWASLTGSAVRGKGWCTGQDRGPDLFK